ncbi:ABC transporter ATP-binding protein [Corynebacterium cystitidis]|uniref:ABC transporter ATP-binding protein n=1 Tax=Corynebacterium cystitidis TaxID=35757 RepID=UPI00211DD7DD|nr:ABC transporter ATP-binding protein [Corynebacterium cystitidis]
MSEANPQQPSASVADPSVVVRNVSKIYPGSGGWRRKKVDDVTAVKGVSLAVEKGESIGFLGQNGSGKSTLLRLIAGAESPTEGEIRVSATPTLLAVGAALIPTLSGRRNIELGCLAKGMSPEQTKTELQDIVEFVDIGDAIDRPLNTYSSGMAARLRFGVGTAGKPDLLIVDEALSTGDAAFSGKAERRMKAMLERSGTLFLVSHAAKEIERNCSRGVWLHKGEIISDGPSEIVCQQYREWVQLRATEEYDDADKFLEEMRQTYWNPTILFDSEVVSAD